MYRTVHKIQNNTFIHGFNTARYTTATSSHRKSTTPPPSITLAAALRLAIVVPTASVVASLPSLVPRTLTGDVCGGGRGILIGFWSSVPASCHTAGTDLPYSDP